MAIEIKIVSGSDAKKVETEVLELQRVAPLLNTWQILSTHVSHAVGVTAVYTVYLTRNT
jgi:hypothetical protein